MSKRLAIVSTHPIQYNAPLFTLLAQQGAIEIFVFYTWGEKVLSQKFDPGFGKTIEWDIPLLHGYNFTFIENVAKVPGSHHFMGIDNPGLVNAIKVFKPDAVMVYGWAFKSHLQVLLYFHKKIPVLFRGDSTLLDETAGIKKLLRRLWLRWVYRHIDVALYAGSANKTYFAAHGVRDSQLQFLPHAVDNHRYRTVGSSEVITTWRKDLCIPEDAILYLFAGKLEPKKNPGLLAEAFDAVGMVNAHLLIAGNGILEAALKTTWAGKPHIHFIPFQNQSMMPSLYQTANVFVLPSQGPGETWGLAINEAMAAELAVIASNKCGAAFDLIKDGINGYIFESGNPESLQSALEKTNDTIKSATMGKASVALIKSWNYNIMAEIIERAVNKSL